jgi:hypothetical protein
MGLGCLVEAGLFGDNILHRRSPDLQTFSPLFVVYRNPLHSGLFRFARGSCDRLAERSEKGLDRGKSAVKYRVFIGFFADSISDLESFRAFRLNMYLARNG